MWQRASSASGGGSKNILALWDFIGTGTTDYANCVNNGYNEDIFEYVSGNFRSTNVEAVAITLKSKVSGTLNIKRAVGTAWGSLTINGSTMTNTKTSQVSINVGDTVIWESEQYYQQIVISYTK